MRNGCHGFGWLKTQPLILLAISELIAFITGYLDGQEPCAFSGKIVRPQIGAVREKTVIHWGIFPLLTLHFLYRELFEWFGEKARLSFR